MPRTPATPSAPSIIRIETAEIAIQQILDGDIPATTRTALQAAKTAVTALRPNINPADHTPIYTNAANGDRVIGCSCGKTPTKRATRVSTTMAYYQTHLARIGVPRTNLYPR